MKMRGSIVNIIVQHLAAGYSVTVFGSTLDDVRVVKRRLLDEIDELGLELKPYSGSIALANGAILQLGQLQTFSGSSFLHTPVVVIVNPDKANQVLLPAARMVACRFPDGKPPIVIEC